MSLLKKLQGASKIDTNLLSKSRIYQTSEKEDVVQLPIPVLNIALSGSLKGGLVNGIWQLVGDSKCYKTLYGLMSVKAYLEKYPDGVCIFYDSEGGARKSYFETMGVDPERVLHKRIKNIEELKFDIASMLDEISFGERVIFFIDSVGLLASKKEATDALNENSAADLTRAKEMASLSRIVTAPIAIKELTCIIVNHAYDGLTQYASKTVGGGKKMYLAADTIWMISRSQEKDGTELAGWWFNIKIEKSRHVHEKSEFSILVRKGKGLEKYSGLLEIGLETGFVQKPKNGWYTRPTVDKDGKNFRMKDTYSKDFWQPLLDDPDFNTLIEQKYKMSIDKMISEGDNETSEETDE